MIFTPQVLVGVLAGSHFNLYLFDVTSLGIELCGGIAIARYARTYSDTRILPILGALVFIAGGVATSRLQHVLQIESYSLIPLQLLALRGVCLRPTASRTLLLILVVAAGVLNPNQVVFLSVVAVFPFVCLHVFQSPHRGKALVALTAAGTVVVLADLPALSAIGEFISLSNRATMDRAESFGTSFPAYNLTSIFLPGLYGVLSWENGGWAPTDLSQDFLYIGVIPAAVLLSSLFCLRRMPVITALCWANVVIWFLFAMGMNTPLYPFLFDHVPGFSAFRRPADGAYLLNLYLALLVGSSRKFDVGRVDARWVLAIVATVLSVTAGITLTLLAQHARQVGHMPDLLHVLRAFAWRLAIVVPIGLALISIDQSAMRWGTAPLVIALTIADLACAGRAGSVFGSAVRGSDLAQVYSGTLSWAIPRSPLEQSITFLQQHAVAGANPAYRMEALGDSLAASMPMAFGIQTTQGYDPLTLRTYNQAIGAQFLQNEAKQFTPAAPNYDSPAYRRLGLRYVLIQRYVAEHFGDFGEFGSAVAKVRAEFMTANWARRLSDEGSYEIWELRNALPRAMVVADDGSERPCDLLSYGTVFIAVACHALAPARLVLGEVVAPGWLACVNGGAAPIEPFHDIFRSVVVPAGDSRIVFRYQPVPFLRTTSCSAP